MLSYSCKCMGAKFIDSEKLHMHPRNRLDIISLAIYIVLTSRT
jgi:hypothetical protein